MRQSVYQRKTGETDIAVSFNLDGTGKCHADTGIGFFNHMLTLFAKHGYFDLEIACKGDLDVDGHHTVEDAGIVLGTAIGEALGKQGRHLPLWILYRSYG